MPTNVMLAHKWHNKIDPTGWLMSEKLDGVRAVYKNGLFLSRNNKPFNAPTFLQQKFDVILDGELWLGRGRFNECSGIVRNKLSPNWSGITYKIIDYVDESGTFSEHYKYLNNIDYSSNISLIEQTICLGLDHLLEFERTIIEQGGEGVMLRNPNTGYQFRRSNDLLKVKRFDTDICKVIGYIEGEGKYEGMMGALVCEYNSTVISVGTGFSDFQRANPPEIGDIIEFKFFEIFEDTRAPRFPVFLKVL